MPAGVFRLLLFHARHDLIGLIYDRATLDCVVKNASNLCENGVPSPTQLVTMQEISMERLE
jgi:hypothetical protein